MSRMINRFEVKLAEFVSNMRSLPFPFINYEWEDANWGDTIRFTRLAEKGLRGNKTVTDDELLPPAYIDIAKAYAVYLRAKQGHKPKNIRNVNLALRTLWYVLDERGDCLSALSSQGYERCLSLIGERYSGQSRSSFTQRLNIFIKELIGLDCIANSFRLRQPFSIVPSDSIMASAPRNKKLPAEEAPAFFRAWHPATRTRRR